MYQTPSYLPLHTHRVLHAADVAAISGANEGDRLSFARDLVLDDVYKVAQNAVLHRLTLFRDESDHLMIAEDSEIGLAGARVHLDCTLTLMSQNTPVSDVIILVQAGETCAAKEVFVLPLAPLRAEEAYQLVGIDTSCAAQKLAHLACVSFARGTHITMGSGRRKCIEDLQPGDPVLTRDEGVQHIRWIGHCTQRAVGDFAPIRILAGTLNNTNDLIVSPNHRLFVHQQTDRGGAGCSEVMIKARHLVNGQSVRVIQGGFVDYYQILFDTHQIIYAEGIAAESMLMDGHTTPLLLTGFAGTAPRPFDQRICLNSVNLDENLLAKPDVAALLRKTSLR